MPLVRVADGFIKVWPRREHQLQIGQLQVRAATDGPVRFSTIRREHAATADQVVDELQWFLGGEERVLWYVEAQWHPQVVDEVLPDLRRMLDHVDAVFGRRVMRAIV